MGGNNTDSLAGTPLLAQTCVCREVHQCWPWQEHSVRKPWRVQWAVTCCYMFTCVDTRLTSFVRAASGLSRRSSTDEEPNKHLSLGLSDQ